MKSKKTLDNLRQVDLHLETVSSAFDVQFHTNDQ